MSQLIPYENPGALMVRATDVAGVCGEIVKRTAQTIQGRKYVRVEGWQSIAAAYGCAASAVNVRKVDGGVRATGELRRISDGVVIATAEGFVGEDEPTWYGGTVVSYGKEKTLPKRADYAIQAMAQTRAISRVCRSAFAFVVVMIDSKLSTTPAEEMGYTIEQDDEKATGGTPPTASASVSPDAGAPGAPSETRDETLTRLCKDAGANKIDLLAKAEVTHADEMSDADWTSAVRYLQKKKGAAAKVAA
jgi:hypothetical protein